MKKILALVPYYNIYPPTSGGSLRCFHLLNQLAGEFDVTAVTFQDAAVFAEAANQYPAIGRLTVLTAPADPVYRDVFSLLPQKFRYALRYRWIKRTFQGPADLSALRLYPLIRQLLKKTKYDFLLLENISSINCVPFIRKLDKDVKLIFDAHNVDSDLAYRDYENNKLPVKVYDLLYKAESTLYKTTDGVIACSQADLQRFQTLNGDRLKAAVIPNGVEVRVTPDGHVAAEKPPALLFCGSLDYEPNIEGLLWFFDKVWPILREGLPGMRLKVIGGGVPDARLDRLKADKGIDLIGRVERVEPYYEAATLAIVPLLSGSGTRLKILEAMSLGLPLVSTSKGAEGIAYTDGGDILIADDDRSFAGAIIRLSGDTALRNELKTRAFRLVADHYDWDLVGQELATFLHSFHDE